MKGNEKMAEQFDVNDNYTRELVKVDYLPDPPATTAQNPPARNTPQPQVSSEEMLMMIFREEAEEIAVRLERIGIRFTTAMQQDVIDHCFTLVALSMQGQMVGGGAISRR